MTRHLPALFAGLMALMGGPLAAQEFGEAEAGVLRWLDKLTGETGDLELARGQSGTTGRLTIQMDSCRYPADNPNAEAEAHLTILDATLDVPAFTGWMLADSPALSAMDHPRYDVWVLRCVVPGAEVQVDETAPDTGEDAPATEDGSGE